MILAACGGSAAPASSSAPAAPASSAPAASSSASAAASASASSAASASAAPAASATGTPVIQIAPVPFTGNESFEIGFSNAGYYPAQWAINNAGGIMGHPLQVLRPDDKSDPADALTAFERTLATNPSTSFAGGDTTTTGALLPVATNAKLPFITASGNAVYDKNTNPYLYRYAPPDPANGEAIALWCKQKGYTSVATVFGNDAGSQGDLPGVVDGIKAIGAKVAVQLNVVPDQPNYRTDVERLIAAKPQAIITESDGPTAATFFSELSQLGTIVPIIGTSGTPSADYFSPLSKAIGAANFQKDFVAVVVGTPQASNPAYKVYADAVQHVGSKLEKPVDQWAANPYTEGIYDTYVIFALAMDQAKSTKGSVFNSFIPGITAPGAGKTVVHSYPEGVAALAKGQSIQYIGAAGSEVLDQHHNWFADQAVEKFDANAVGTVVGVIKRSDIEALSTTSSPASGSASASPSA
ncbi:MAG: ABC transporter substrate-binding protein [Chloroflexota bacterium]